MSRVEQIQRAGEKNHQYVRFFFCYRVKSQNQFFVDSAVNPKVYIRVICIVLISFSCTITKR